MPTRAFIVFALVVSGSSQAAEVYGATSQTMAFEFKLGPHRPLIYRELAGDPYAQTFGNADMLIGEIELDYQFWRPFGSLAAGFAIAYAEKFGPAIDAATGQPASESSGLRIVPMKALLVYRFDWLAQKYSVPLVPYVKGGLVVEPWWVVKGGKIEEADGRRAEGVKFGAAATVGLALQIDFLDPRLARDFDTSAGVNHTYIFAEYAITEVNNFGTRRNAAGQITGLDLSSRNALFGLSFEF